VVDARSKDDFDSWLKAKAAEQKQQTSPATAQSVPGSAATG